MPLNKYASQVTTHRRTQSAIFEATKSLIISGGIKKMSMIEIADTSQISRATLYNHYRDKESVIRALCEYEISQLVSLVQSAPNPTEALELLSLQISNDLALAAARKQDAAALTTACSAQSDPLWRAFTIAIENLIHNQDVSQLAIRWLIGQVFHPLSPEQSRQQAEAITTLANI